MTYWFIKKETNFHPVFPPPFIIDLNISKKSWKFVLYFCCQVGSALQWIHSKNLCHLDVKLDNILVFKSDFTLVKLCDFGAVRHQGDIVIKKNELLPYCPAELVAKHANEYYQVDRVQDVFQFGIVVFFCLLGVLPWQKADRTDPNYQDFCAWREKRSSKVRLRVLKYYRTDWPLQKVAISKCKIQKFNLKYFSFSWHKLWKLNFTSYKSNFMLKAVGKNSVKYHSIHP